MKKLTCHCGGVEAEVKLPEQGFEKLIRCNCSICKRKGFIMSFVGPEDLKIVKGQDLLKLYQFHTNTANISFVQTVEFILMQTQEVIQKYIW